MARNHLIGQALKKLAGIDVDTLTELAESISQTELDYLDGVTAGTVTASKAVVADSSSDVTGLGDVTATSFNGQVNYTSVARTATADGTGTGTIADAGLIQFVAVTSADATHIVVLPTPTPGTIVILYVGANGYELRSSAPATVAINGGAGSDFESAIAANQMAVLICTSATTWHGFEITAATLTAVEAAA